MKPSVLKVSITWTSGWNVWLVRCFACDWSVQCGQWWPSEFFRAGAIQKANDHALGLQHLARVQDMLTFKEDSPV